MGRKSIGTLRLVIGILRILLLTLLAVFLFLFLHATLLITGVSTQNSMTGRDKAAILGQQTVADIGTASASGVSVCDKVAEIKSDLTNKIEKYETTKVRCPPPYKLVIEPKEQAGSAQPESLVVYTFTVMNHGSMTDNVRPEAVSLKNWNVTSHIVEPKLPPSASTSLFVTITVPITYSGSTDQVTITVRSLDPAGDDMATIATAVEQSACITISRGSEVVVPPSEAPGHTVFFPHIIRNCGNGTDTVTVTVDSTVPSWLEPLSSLFTTTIKAWSNEPIVVTATILTKPAERESPGYLIARATSGVNDLEEETATNTVHVKQLPGVTLSPGNEQEICASVITTYDRFLPYTHILTNTGNDSDAFTITQHSSAGWYGNPAPRIIGPVSSGGDQEFVVTVTVPGGVGAGVDRTWVTATSWFSSAVSASARNTTTVCPCKTFLPLVTRCYCAPNEIVNGCFVSPCSFAPWWKEDGNLNRKVVAEGEDADNPFGCCTARLGDPAYSNQNVPGDHATIYQTVTVPHTPSRLMILYEVFSYDIMQGITGRLYDSFEVAINNRNNAIFRTGNPQGIISDCRSDVWKSGVQTELLDLTPYAGQTITLYFSVWNRQDSRCNTWTYIGSIQIVP